MFATLYGLIWHFIPNSFTNIPSGPYWQADGTIVYFSFVALTSTGFGDVTPLHQLFPATLLARLITLELRGTDSAPEETEDSGRRRVSGGISLLLTCK